MESSTRRTFAKSAATLTAAGYARILGANDHIRLGFIGLGNRGSRLLEYSKEFADQEAVAVCDLVDDLLDHAVETAGNSPARYKDFRRLIERNDVDAVVVATPDHWHALMMIQACRAGKDVYVEKPLSLTVVEGRKMVDTARETERVVQVGIHRRSSPFCREAAEIVSGGGIGRLSGARCGVAINQFPAGIGSPDDGEPPEGVDWALYLGPAPEAAYNENRHLFRFRWFYDYGGGQLTDNGVHFLDLIQWGLGKDKPTSVTALGGNYVLEDNREVPDTLQALWEYPGGPLVSFTQYSANAAPFSNTQPLLAEFRGTQGTMNVYFGGWEIVPEKNSGLAFPASSPLDREASARYRGSFTPALEARSGSGSADPRLHIRNFLDCVKSRAKPNCDVETAHRSTTTANIGAIAYRTKQHLEWDAEAERFTNSEQANSMLSYEYRKPWVL